MESNVRFSSVTGILAGVCAFIVASMGLYAVGLGDWMVTALLAWPGAFLIQSFGILSLYIPFLFGVLAWMSSQPVLKPSLLVPLGISVLPFLTLSALFQSLDPASTSPASVMARTMGAASPVFLGLLTVLEVLVGAVVTLSITQQQTGGARPADPDAVFEGGLGVPSPRVVVPEVRGPVPEMREPETNGAATSYDNLKTSPPDEIQTDVLRVPHIKGWDSARALRDDPYRS